MQSHRTQASKSGLHSLNNTKALAMSQWRALLQSSLQSASEYMNVTASTTTITFCLLIVPQQLHFFFIPHLTHGILLGAYDAWGKRLKNTSSLFLEMASAALLSTPAT